MFNTKFFIPLTLFFASLLTGCSQSPKQPHTEAKVASSTSDTSKSAVLSAVSSTMDLSASAQSSIQNTVTDTTTAQALLTVLSGLMFKSFNENPNQPLTTEQKTCLIQANYQEQLPNFQSYLQRKLTTDELTKTNQYYALPVGKKQIQLANQQLHASKGEKIGDLVKLTDDEKLQIQAFQGTPEGQKLALLLSPANQGELEKALIEPMMTKVTTDCHMTIATLEKLEKSAKTANAVSSPAS